MLKKTLGTDGPEVSAIGVGTWGLGGFGQPSPGPFQEALDALRFSFERGVTFLDTAEGYGGGRSEELAGSVLADHPVAVGTKVSPENLTPARIRRSVDGSLRRLGRERLDLYQIHWSNPTIPIAETAGALDDLFVEGKIGGIGVCNFSLAEMDELRAHLSHARLNALQAEYNLFDRSCETAYLPYCLEHGMAFLAYSPLDQGAVCGSSARRAALSAIAERNGCAVGTLALAWLIRHPAVIAIPKAARISHAAQNAEAGSLRISDADADAIDRLTRSASALLPVGSISAVPAEADGRPVFKTVEEARANTLGMTPSPMDLARQMLAGDFLKPVRVRRAEQPSDGREYELIEGRLRYWAWVIAHDGERDIPALIREP